MPSYTLQLTRIQDCVESIDCLFATSNQSINQSNNQSTNLQINPSINQSINDSSSEQACN